VTERRRTIDEILEEARKKLQRVAPEEAKAAVDKGAILVDIRQPHQRAEDGTIPGAIYHPRNVLEWRMDPDCEASDPELSRDLGREVILFCDEGYTSSLAAASVQELGFPKATDLVGGFQAWRDAGLPVIEP
jgi:rhodanese-related sulfurtransferase